MSSRNFVILLFFVLTDKSFQLRERLDNGEGSGSGVVEVEAAWGELAWGTRVGLGGDFGDEELGVSLCPLVESHTNSE